MMVFQIFGVWYALLLSGVFLTTDTSAYFNDVETIDNYLHVNWDGPDQDEWDKSSLTFDGSTAGGTCQRIYNTISNSGDAENSLSTWRFYLYEVNEQNQIDGDAIDTGVVPAIPPGQSDQIESTKIQENKSYRYVVRRPLGHPGKNNPDENNYSYIKSDHIIHVQTCESDPQVIVSSGESEHEKQSGKYKPSKKQLPNISNDKNQINEEVVEQEQLGEEAEKPQVTDTNPKRIELIEKSQGKLHDEPVPEKVAPESGSPVEKSEVNSELDNTTTNNDQEVDDLDQTKDEKDSQ